MTGRPPAHGRTEAEAGTSIVEVLVATALLSVGVLVVLASIGAAERATAAGERRSAAVRLASDELESIRSLRYDDIGIAPSSDGYVPRFEGRPTVSGSVNRVEASGTTDDGATTFDVERHVTWSAIDVGGARIDDGFKLVTVVVAWSDPAGDHRIRHDTGIYRVGGGS